MLVSQFRKTATLLTVSVVFALGATGCATSKKTSSKHVEKASVVTTAPVVVQKRDIRAENIQRLLSAADDALAVNRLTTPVQDNAYDRYQAVLMMDAQNERAEAGIQAIFSRYASLTRSAIRQGDYSKARSRLQKARFVDSRHVDLKRLSNELASSQRERAPQPAKKVAAVAKNEDEIILNASSLTRRDEELVDQLQSLAIDLKEKDESILIFARNDAEGRWIYKKMAEAVIGYRLRGDMRIGKKPKIQILPPID
ncbi:MAG: hypothetical protein ACRBCS_07645 [Cellvibrionaceae bacterium]